MDTCSLKPKSVSKDLVLNSLSSLFMVALISAFFFFPWFVVLKVILIICLMAFAVFIFVPSLFAAFAAGLIGGPLGIIGALIPLAVIVLIIAWLMGWYETDCQIEKRKQSEEYLMVEIAEFLSTNQNAISILREADERQMEEWEKIWAPRQKVNPYLESPIEDDWYDWTINADIKTAPKFVDDQLNKVGMTEKEYNRFISWFRKKDATDVIFPILR